MESNFKINSLFGSWRVLDEISKTLTKARTRHYLCLCTKCNITKRYVSGIDLKSGKSKHCNSCGQYNGYKELSGSYLASVKKGAKLRNLEYSVSSQYLYDLLEEQDFKCAISGLPIKINKNYYKREEEHSASIDRIDNSKGYIIGNIHWIHRDLNIMRNKYSIEYFIKICKKVVENNK